MNLIVNIFLRRTELKTEAFNPRPRLPRDGFSCPNRYSLFYCPNRITACCCDIGTTSLRCVSDFAPCDFNGGAGDVCM